MNNEDVWSEEWWEEENSYWDEYTQIQKEIEEEHQEGL